MTPLLLLLAAAAQDAMPPVPDEKEVIVTGQRPRGSAIESVEPIATLDQQALRALGATSMTQVLERLKALSTSNSGSDPVLLLNGRRISGFEELQSLPPEAIENTEILPEEEAPRFGFPPTVRIMNFITRKRFRAVTTHQLAGTSTEGGGATNYAELTSTRLDNDRRVSLSVSHFRMNPVLQAQRDVLADPATLFAVQGNVAAPDGGSIDSRLDALAGQAVRVAPVPGDVAQRGTLAGYVAGANRPALTDLGSVRTLQPRGDTLKADGTVAAPLGRTLTGSLNLTMEAQRFAGLNGLAPALLRVPGNGGALPFADDVLLYRYLPGIVLRQRSTNLNLHAGSTLNGSVGRWTWNASATFDRVRSSALADQGVVTDALQRAIDAGGDPLLPIDPATGRRLVNVSRTVTRTLVGKAVANGPLLRLPAGPAQVTLTADYARSSSDGFQPGIGDAALDLSRTTRGASINAALPIAAESEGVLSALGRLSANATLGVSDVSDFGRLTSSNLALNWAPRRAVQFSASVNETQTAPAITSLTTATISTPNVPYFDFTTGTDVIVTAVSGGNPTLAPERRRITTLGVALMPLKRSDLRIGIDYVDTRIRNQAAALGAATPLLQAAFPERFVRDAAGRLTQVDLRSANLADEHERKVQLTSTLFTQLGRAPAPPDPKAAPNTPPPPPPKPRPSIFTSLTATLRLQDRVTLRPGVAPLDLLDGQTLDGTGGRPRWELEGNLGGNVGPLSVGTFSRLQGPTRVRSTLPASDLRFSGRTWIVLYSSLDVERIVPRRWTQRMSLQLTVENLLNDRIDVRDGAGTTPFRYQSAFLDPVGRSIRLGVRKLF